MNDEPTPERKSSDDAAVKSILTSATEPLLRSQIVSQVHPAVDVPAALKRLRKAGLVTTTGQRRGMRYSLATLATTEVYE